MAKLFRRRCRRIGGLALLAASVAIVWPGIIQYGTTGQVDMHWSRALVSSLLLVVAAVLGITTFLLNMMDLIREQHHGIERVRTADRSYPARGSAA